MCVQGTREVAEEAMEDIEDKNLRVFVVWIPQFPGDSREKAARSANLVKDSRAVHFWDSDKRFGRSYGKIVKLPKWTEETIRGQPFKVGNRREVAWDIYSVYDGDAVWENVPPKPNDWMHQLGFDARGLDAKAFAGITRRLLRDLH